MAQKRIFTDDEKELIIQLYQDGETLANIKKKLHCAFDTIKDFLDENHIATRKLISPKKRIFHLQEQALILQMCENGSTAVDICRAVNCSEKVLTNFFREHHIHKERVKTGPPCLTHEQFLLQLKEVTQDIVPIDNYIKRSVPIYFECLKCHYRWLARPGNILAGHKCPMCNDTIPYTQESFINKVNQYNPDIDIIGLFTGTHQRVRCRCKICQMEWEPLASSILSGKGCPKCKESYGEKQIRNYLEKCNVEFVAQYKFNDCKRIRPLPFDFYLPSFNMVIEYDGQQHFGEVEVFGGRDRFLYTQENDRIKTDYCERNNITLVRIPYWELNDIHNILTELITIQND